MTRRALIGLLGALLTLSALPAHAGPEQTATAVKVRYPGHGVEVWRHSGKVAALTGTPGPSSASWRTAWRSCST